MIRIKLPRPEPMDSRMKMLTTTHGKNGVPELRAVSDCSRERHKAVAEDIQLFETFVRDQRIQHDDDGEPLMVLGQCVGCGTTIGRVVSEEARLRLGETPDETKARHKSEGRHASG